MAEIIKQHLLCATRKDLDEYFSDVQPVTEETDFRGADSKFEIPTWTINQQLNDIESKEAPKTGFVWYFIRKVKNKPNGDFDVEMGVRQEMVWIKNESLIDPYIIKIFNELMRHFSNSNIMEKK